MSIGEKKVRLDKWLWAARFFKTRALASAAVTGGKVHRAGQRIKPSRSVKIGDCFEITRGYERYEVIVTDLSERRGSACCAQTLYRETESSIDKRYSEAEKRRLAIMQRPHSTSRPDKKQRRQIRQFNGKS
jgi:ribosome-associated heat shock protein Hsp15